ncbi:siderophore-interacting protein [Pedobacter antarcticus]|uniref:siderophore-interacting protein n=1 Tax=Pedobacter antarcticus TaxID=34086 RepID=UPI001C56CFF3|nr:siderophore-interacting protein [Pedobacter antarcticus]
MNIIQRKAMQLIENSMLKSGTVLAIRSWEPATFYEIDVHLPGVNMYKWQSVQHIKVKVAPYTYRDYTPTLWDPVTCTCTLMISAAHHGPGSHWAASLTAGDTLDYMGIGSTLHKPVDGDLLVIGDQSSLGHFLALRQLALGIGELQGAIGFSLKSHVQEFRSYFDTLFQPVHEQTWDYSLVSWLDKQDLNNETVYLAGHIPTIVELRKNLRIRKDFTGKVKVQGFWS